MLTIKQHDPETALCDPASAFARPMDVVKENGLTRGQKLAVLRRWAEALQHQLAATSEGMQTAPGTTSHEVDVLDEIKKAQVILRQGRDPDPHHAT